MDPAFSDQVVAGLRRAHPGKDRAGQLTMIKAVADAIERTGQVVVSAPTGTGKGAGYLVPAILSGKRTVVVTMTKALQDQLANEDLPHLQRTLGRPFTFAVVKGRSNYACRARLAEAMGEDTFAEISGDFRTADDEIVRVAEWASNPACDGDLAAINISPRAREAVTVTSDECPGAKKCPQGRTCFAVQAKERAGASNIIVANMALYARDVAADGMLLPDHEVVIVDEAHRLEDVMTEGLGVELDARSLTKLTGLITYALAGDVASGLTLSRLAEATTELTSIMEALVADGAELLSVPFPAPLDRAIDAVTMELMAALKALEATGTVVEGEMGEPETVFDDARAQRAHTMGTRLYDRLRGIRLADDDSAVYVEGSALKVVPLDVSEALRSDVWRDRATVITSATIPPNITERLGLSAGVLQVPSPFDLERNAMLYVAKHLANPNDPEWIGLAHDEMEALISAAGGRTLALFSSRRLMERAAEEMRRRLPFRIITSDEMSKPLAIRTFADEPETCLFGTQGLYEGVNVPGETCSLVIIDKVPFHRPGDPLAEARKAAAGGGFAAFKAVNVPHAAVLLTQAAGRLIRSETDRGVVAILDGRIATKWKSYGADLVEGLHPMRMTSDRSTAIDFLHEVTAAPSALAGVW